MSRSTKHTAICGIAKPDSAKDYKKSRAGAERAHERDLIREASKGNERAAESLEVETKPWNEWSCDRDGKQYFGNMEDQEYKRKLMRK